MAGQRHPGALAPLHVAHAHHHRTDEAQPRRGGEAARRGALRAASLGARKPGFGFRNKDAHAPQGLAGPPSRAAKTARFPQLGARETLTYILYIVQIVQDNVVDSTL